MYLPALSRKLALACAVAGIASAAYSQQPGSGAQAPTPSGAIGYANQHVILNCAAPATITGATFDDGSNDCSGAFVASATSGVLTFAVPFVRPPFCDLTAYSGTQPTYTVSPTAITISTEVSGTRYTYQCVARPGG